MDTDPQSLPAQEDASKARISWKVYILFFPVTITARTTEEHVHVISMSFPLNKCRLMMTATKWMDFIVYDNDQKRKS